MYRAVALLSAAAVLVLANVAFASDPASETAQYFGHIYVDAQTGNIVQHIGGVPAAGASVYSNITSSVNAAISSPGLGAQWGDRIITAGSLGFLSELDLTVYNASTAANTLTACEVSVNFFNGPTFSFIGGYTGNVTFNPPLPGGFYAIVTFTNLVPNVINLQNDMIVMQTLTGHTGAADRLGVVSMDPPTIGSSDPTMFISSGALGLSGFYQLTVGGQPVNSNTGYRIAVQGPVPTEPATWGKVKSLFK